MTDLLLIIIELDLQMESARFRVERSVSFPLYDFLESILRI